MSLLMNKNTEKKKIITQKGGKMKKICALILMSLLLTVGANCFADDIPAPALPTAATVPIVSTTRNTTIHVEYTYNAFGVAISSLQKATTFTKTIDANGGWSESTSVSTTESCWRGGSLKVNFSSGTTETEGSDGSNSDTTFATTYAYNSNGQLSGASGGSTTTGDRGNDANGEAIGTFKSSSTNTYEIRNGQALLKSSTSNGTNFGPDGVKTGDFGTTVTHTHKMIGGSWHIMSSTTVSTSNGTDGSTESTTKTLTYERDAATGVCIGLTQTATGTKTSVNENGGKTTYKMCEKDGVDENGNPIYAYKAIPLFDAEVGWFISFESWDWVDVTE